MTITAIILSHYKERENNLKRIVDDLLEGTVIPEQIIIFIDNSFIQFQDKRVTIINSSKSFMPNIRFAIGSVCNTDYCFFIDDDLSVRKKTLENFVYYADKLPISLLGLEGSILGNTDTPYSNDISIKRNNRISPLPVDIIIRTYFAFDKSIIAGLLLRASHPDLPRESLDDVFLCLGNKYLVGLNNHVIPVNEETDLIELPDGGVGQSLSENHYKNRNIVCRFLMNEYL